MKETILLINMKDRNRLTKLRMACLPLKVRMKSIEKEDYKKPVGYLAGVKGILDNGAAYEGEELDQEMMVLVGLSGFRLDQVLSAMKKAGVRIDYKAVLTEENQKWDCIRLYEELAREHKTMHGQIKAEGDFMKIIDAHLHLHNNENFNRLAVYAGHENTEENLKESFEKEDIVHGIIMGNEGLNPQEVPDFLSYCVGIDRECLMEEGALEKLEAHLKKKSCVGIKIYSGYCRCYIYDSVYTPAYELARFYKKPVAFHMGVTAGHAGLLKYSHPLAVDEVASAFPQVEFVICYFGNPWLMDAAAVMDKNENVSMDLSGFLEDRIPGPVFYEEHREFINYAKAALQFIDGYDKIMYGTDWPLVNITEYIGFVKAMIPEKHWNAVFYENAKRIYQLDL